MRLGPTVVLGLAGAGLAAVSSGQVWARATARAPALQTVEARGAEVAPLAVPLALVALASWGAVLVLRRRGRRVVAAIGLVAAVGAMVAVLLRVRDAAEVALSQTAPSAEQVSSTATAWPWLVLVGGGVSAVLSVVTLREAARWPEMSSRYDAAGATRDGEEPARAGEQAPPPGEPTAAELWRALDEGRDPTV